MPYFPPIQQEQYPATDETQCIRVIIPAGDEFKALLAGLVVEASDVNNYADPDSAAAEGQAAIWDNAYSLIDWSGCPPEAGMLQLDLFTINATPLAGVGTLSYNASTSLPFGFAMFTQNVTLYGMEQPIWLAAGEYAYDGWCTQNSVAGNTAVAITDGTGVVDEIIAAFSQVGTFGVRVKKSGTFSITTSGLYKIVAGNVSAVSGNHFCNWISHHIRQTS